MYASEVGAEDMSQGHEGFGRCVGMVEVQQHRVVVGRDRRRIIVHQLAQIHIDQTQRIYSYTPVW